MVLDIILDIQPSSDLIGGFGNHLDILQRQPKQFPVKPVHFHAFIRFINIEENLRANFQRMNDFREQIIRDIALTAFYLADSADIDV